jgi:hypothetical protein
LPEVSALILQVGLLLQRAPKPRQLVFAFSPEFRVSISAFDHPMPISARKVDLRFGDPARQREKLAIGVLAGYASRQNLDFRGPCGIAEHRQVKPVTQRVAP